MQVLMPTPRLRVILAIENTLAFCASVAMLFVDRFQPLSHRRRNGKPNRHRRPMSFLTLQSDGPTVVLHQLLAQTQP